jgi:GT2 family glycosyltransferase/SAM-dependent methyltransferase
LISAVICTHNRAALLQQALGALCAQTIGLDQFEVIVIDDGSSDDTREVVQRFASILNLHYAYQANAGLAAGKNHGLCLAATPLVAFLDDDDVLDNRCLEEHYLTHQRFPEPHYAVLGYTGLAREPARSPLMHYVTEVGCQLFSYPYLKHDQVLDFSHFWGGRSSCKRGFLLEHGIFDPRFRFGAEDIELGFRLQKVGLRVVYNAGAVAYMLRTLSFDDFCRRCELQGRSNWLFSQLHQEPAVRTWAEVEGIEGEWAAIEPRFRDIIKAARELDRFAQVRAQLELPLDELATRLLHRAYRAAFRASRIRGTIERMREQDRAARGARPDTDPGGEKKTLRVVSFGDLSAYKAFRMSAERDSAALESAIVANGEPLEHPGFCYVCDRPVRFRIDFNLSYRDRGCLTPNWRETAICPSCGLHNRKRAVIHLFEQMFSPAPQAAIYLTERATQFYTRFLGRHPGVIGSELIGDAVPFGSSDAQGIRNEDVTRLSFDDASLDHVLSFDVLEHVPDYPAALAEFFRVLRPGGSLLLSVPFLPDAGDTLVRARLADDGAIVHILSPEYHGDPLRAEGCLAFYQFGWDLLGALATVGFKEVRAHAYSSLRFGYLGPDQLLFSGRHP